MTHPKRKELERRVTAWIILMVLTWLTIGLAINAELSGIYP